MAGSVRNSDYRFLKSRHPFEYSQITDQLYVATWPGDEFETAWNAKNLEPIRKFWEGECWAALCAAQTPHLTSNCVSPII
jgi:hypothetical protein